VINKKVGGGAISQEVQMALGTKRKGSAVGEKKKGGGGKNKAAIPPFLKDSTLFSYERGVFTWGGERVGGGGGCPRCHRGFWLGGHQE